MARKKRRKNRLDELVIPRANVHVNQTGSGFHEDRRTHRGRDRSTREREAIDREEESQ